MIAIVFLGPFPDPALDKADLVLNLTYSLTLIQKKYLLLVRTNVDTNTQNTLGYTAAAGVK